MFNADITPLDISQHLASLVTPPITYTERSGRGSVLATFVLFQAILITEDVRRLGWFPNLNKPVFISMR